MSGFLSFKALLVGLVVGLFGAATGYAVANGGGDSGASRYSMDSLQTSTSGDVSNGCEIPDELQQDIAAGGLTEERACEWVRLGERAITARQGPPDFSEGPSLVIEGSVHDDMVAACRAGTFNSGEGAEVDGLYCNTILKIAAGELKPTRTCEPPECSAPKPLWEYGEAQLRNHSGVAR